MENLSVSGQQTQLASPTLSTGQGTVVSGPSVSAVSVADSPSFAEMPAAVEANLLASLPPPKDMNSLPMSQAAVKVPLVPGVLSVLMPIYNEHATLPTLLQRILAVPVEKEIVLVDDGSTDGTRELLQTQVDGKIPGVRVFYHDHNQGKGAAIRTAIPYAVGDYCIVQDGDMEYDPQDYVAILEAFARQNADVVYGSRFLNGWPAMRLPNRIVNKLLAWMVRFFFHSPMTDEATCYKAFRTSVLQSLPLTCRRFEFCPEVTAKALRRGHRIVEVPIHYQARSMADGKKIRWTDGVAAIWTLFKFRFVRF